MSSLVSLIVSFVVSLVTTILILAVIEAMRRRGLDPVRAIADFLSPSPVDSAAVSE